MHRGANERQVQTIREINRREVKLDQTRIRQTFKVKQETSLTPDRGDETRKQNQKTQGKSTRPAMASPDHDRLP